MIAIYAEKPDMGTKIAAALDGIHLHSGKTVCFDDISKYDRQIKAQRTADGFFEIQYLGQPCKVTWGYGHMCELKQAQDYNKEYKNWRKLPLPFIPENYELKLNKGASKQYNVIKRIFKDASLLVCATDDDREGDLIFDYLYRYMKCRVPFKRALFNKQSEDEFKKAFSEKMLVDGVKRIPVIEAGRARGAGDFIVGAGPTAALTLKYPGSDILSIGRVQTATLNLIVVREQEIRAFKPQDFFTVKAVFKKGGASYNAVHSTKRFDKRSDAEAVIRKLNNTDKKGVIQLFETVQSNKQKPYLYSLQTLQMDANKKYGFSLEEVAKCAQSLYDKGFTTYPRTDSMHLTEDMVPEMEKVLQQLSQRPEYQKFFENRTIALSNKDKHYFDNKKVDSHYAIVPTSKNASGLSDNESKIYNLIAKSVICMIYPNAVMSKTTISTDVHGEVFRTSETSVASPGFFEVVGMPKEGMAPDLKTGDIVDGRFQMESKKTEPPKRYTEGTLLNAMINCGKTIEDEELRDLMSKGGDGKPRGLGRPSTQANIVHTLLERKYIRMNKRTILPTDKGMNLIRVLPVEDLKSAVMTAQWEKRLDGIQNGTDTYDSFMHDLEDAVRSWTLQIMKLEGEKKMAYPEKEKYTGVWEGEEVSFNRQWGNHFFTDEECESLLAGEEIVISGLKGSNGTYSVSGKLTRQEYRGNPFVGFERTGYVNSSDTASNSDRYQGVWHGNNVSFKRVWGSHTFTDAECEALLRGEEIEIHGLKGSGGGSYGVKGKLTEQEYNGHKFVGFERTEFLREENQTKDQDRVDGIWNGKQISFKRTWGSYRFTDDECQRLLNGETIDIHGLKGKTGSTYGVRGKLSEQQYRGRPFVGFERIEYINDRPQANTADAARCTGVWNGKEISFKRKWSTHTFTDDECRRLLAGETIEIRGLKNRDGGEFGVRGELQEQTYNGHAFVGFTSLEFL